MRTDGNGDLVHASAYTSSPETPERLHSCLLFPSGRIYSILIFATGKRKRAEDAKPVREAGCRNASQGDFLRRRL
jgi:hypothetical protein